MSTTRFHVPFVLLFRVLFLGLVAVLGPVQVLALVLVVLVFGLVLVVLVLVLELVLGLGLVLVLVVVRVVSDVHLLALVPHLLPLLSVYELVLLEVLFF